MATQSRGRDGDAGKGLLRPAMRVLAVTLATCLGIAVSTLLLFGLLTLLEGALGSDGRAGVVAVAIFVGLLAALSYAFVVVDARTDASADGDGGDEGERAMTGTDETGENRGADGRTPREGEGR